MSRALESAVIRDLVRENIDTGRWSAPESLAALTTVLAVLAIDMAVPRYVVIEAVGASYDDASRSR